MAKDKKKDKKPANLQTFMLSQDFLPEHWDWSLAEKAALVDCEKTAKVIMDRFNAQGISLVEAHAIAHDKDEHEIFDEYQNQYISNFTSNHMHFVGKLSKDDAQTIERIAEIIGVESNYIERPKAGRYAYDNMLSYLIHIKYPEKYQYDPHAVYTLSGTPYIQYYRENHRSWMRGRTEKIMRDEPVKLSDLRVLIAEDKITEKEVYFDPRYNQVLHDHLDTIEKLFENQRSIKARRDGTATNYFVGRD